jgi:hypothetical protein
MRKAWLVTLAIVLSLPVPVLAAQAGWRELDLNELQLPPGFQIEIYAQSLV